MELQNLQRSSLQHPNEPPPEYGNAAKPRTLKNPFLPAEMKTKVCTIL